MEYAEFMLRLKVNYFLRFFDNYFTHLERVHRCNTRQTQNKGYCYHSIGSESMRKRLYYSGLKLWEMIPTEKKNLLLFKFKKMHLVRYLELFQYIYYV